MKRILGIVALVIVTLLTSKPVLAVRMPDFPSCNAPQGEVVSSYDSGVHGIVGDPKTFNGSDIVYKISPVVYTQCFCADNGTGIQTNWWNASSLSDEDIAVLKSQGWYYVPNGNLWGLTADPYVAQNIYFNCKPGSPGTGGGGSSGGSSTSGIGGGEVLSSAIEKGDVLGLAATGDVWLLYAVFGLAFILLGAGSRLLKRSLDRS